MLQNNEKEYLVQGRSKYSPSTDLTKQQFFLIETPLICQGYLLSDNPKRLPLFKLKMSLSMMKMLVDYPLFCSHTKNKKHYICILVIVAINSFQANVTPALHICEKYHQKTLIVQSIYLQLYLKQCLFRGVSQDIFQ